MGFLLYNQGNSKSQSSIRPLKYHVTHAKRQTTNDGWIYNQGFITDRTDIHSNVFLDDHNIIHASDLEFHGSSRVISQLLPRPKKIVLTGQTQVKTKDQPENPIAVI